MFIFYQLRTYILIIVYGSIVNNSIYYDGVVITKWRCQRSRGCTSASPVLRPPPHLPQLFFVMRGRAGYKSIVHARPVDYNMFTEPRNEKRLLYLSSKNGGCRHSSIRKFFNKLFLQSYEVLKYRGLSSYFIYTCRQVTLKIDFKFYH